MISAWSCILTIALLSLLLFSGQTTAQLVPDFRVNDDITSGNQFLPKIGVAKDGSFVIVWRDSHNGSNILCRRYSATATALGPSFRINVIADTSGLPDIAVKEDGSFGVCWRAGNSTMFGQTRMVIRLFNNDGSPKTGEIFVNDTLGNFAGNPSIAVSEKDGSYIVTWSYTSSSFQRHDIYYQRVDSMGNKIGNNVLVNDNQDDYNQDWPCITVRRDGSFIIAWEDLRPPAINQNVYMQMFAFDGAKIGVNKKVNDDTILKNGSQTPKISSDTSGAFILAWSDSRLDFTELEVFAQLYNADGTEYGVNFRVSQHNLDWTKGIGGASKQETGEFVVGWRQELPGGPIIYQPYIQRYMASGQMIGINYLITSQAHFATKDYSDVKLKDNRIYSVWADNRAGFNDFDIYCNILSFTNPDSTVSITQISTEIPGRFKLYQNYPNPFNPSTTISFDIPQTALVKLTVYDALGREVATLVNENLTAGVYQYQFTTDEYLLPSGVYFYRLNAGEFSETKRMVLLK